MASTDSQSLAFDAPFQQALAHHQAGRLNQAEQLYRAILQAFPKHADANHNLGVVAVQVGQPAAGLPFLKAATEVNPSHEQYVLSYGEALLVCAQFSEARQQLASAIERGLNSQQIQSLLQKVQAAISNMPAKGGEPSASEVANLIALFNAGRVIDMESAARTLAERYPQSGFIWKAYGAALQAQGKDALSALRRAVALLPRDAEAFNNLGNALQSGGQHDEAVSHYRLAVDIKPEFAMAHCGLGIALHSLKKIDDAIASFRRAISINPNYVEAHNNLGRALRANGHNEEAVASYQQALKLKPDFAEGYNNLGNVMVDLGHTEKAVASYQRAVEMKPGFAEAHNNLGTAFRKLGQFKNAATSYSRALEINANFADAHCNLGNTLRDLGLYEDAVISCRRAISLKPDFAEACNNLGNALCDLRQFDEAIRIFQRLIESTPDYIDAYCNLGNVYWRTAQLDEAVAICRRALAISPGSAVAHNNLGTALRDSGSIDEAAQVLQRAIEIDTAYVLAHQNYLMTLQFLPATDRQIVFDAHVQFGRQFEAPLQPQWQAHANARDPDKRLKVGYVSGDFRAHAVAYFIEPVLAHHDKSQIEVFCYSNSVRRDAVTERLMTEADHWVPCFSLSDDELAARIRADGIDILVDLSGHTAHNRLLTFARKPAPIQITYLGYPGTTGLAAMDYRLTDAHTEPEGAGADQYYTEELLRLPDSIWCYRPSDDMPEITPLPALANGYLTFGSFNNVNKVGPESIALWAKLLNALPTSRLLMVTVPEGKMRERLTDKFKEHGVSADRIDFDGILPPHEFQRKLQQVDITLDPFPVNGATTTCESLWLGVPVLSLVGERFLSRAGLSVLDAAQLPEFAAPTQAAYIQTAMSLANKLVGLAELRVGMRERLKTTPLFDQQRFARNFETMYRGVWQRYTSK